MQFPEQYKCDQTKIIKFDRNGDKELEYKFFKLFPKNLTSIPVSYGTSDILKVSASFEYERYVSGKLTSKSVKDGTSNNRGSVKTRPINDSLRRAQEQTGRLDLTRPFGIEAPLA